MRIHYINLVFALFGYRIFMVDAGPAHGSEASARTIYIIISKRVDLPAGEKLTGVRLGGNVLVDKERR
jgi:hypothetical protein